jgi:predicted nucleic acid-binding protein
MGSFVLDTSIAFKSFLEDESDRAYSLAILEAITDDYRPAVPWLWYYEIESTNLVQVRRKRIVFEQAVDYLKIIYEMVVDTDPPDCSAILQLPHLAQAHNLTGYDAAFLELAMRLQLPLATNDKALVLAAADTKVQLLKILGVTLPFF